MQLGDLLYNVQITRILNPRDRRGQGLPGGPARRRPGTSSTSGCSWRSQNEAGTRLQRGARPDFEVVDTAGHRIRAGAEPEPVRARRSAAGWTPNDRAARARDDCGQRPIQGAMVLFLVDRPALEELPAHLSTSRRRRGAVGARSRLDI